jgi:hypothetical protein
VTCLLKARIVEPAEMAVAREWLCKRHVSIATAVYTTMEVLPGTVFSMKSAAIATSHYDIAAEWKRVFGAVHPEAI